MIQFTTKMKNYMDISNMSQVEIEQAFSSKDVIEAIKVESEISIGILTADDEYDKLFYPIISNDYIDLLLLIMRNIFDPNLKVNDRYKMHPNARLIDPTSLIKFISHTAIMQNEFPDDVERYEKAIEIVLYLDGTFYDMKTAVIAGKEKEDVSVTMCVVSFTFDIDPELYPTMEFFKLPLVEQPKDWTVHESGGYHMSEQSCTLNLGESEQPQQCLNILNALQSNKYQVTEGADEFGYKDFVHAKAMEKYNSITDADKIVQNTTQFYQRTLDIIGSREFMMEWRFDFRGRLYSTGYNINLQADKYKKGAICPAPSNFKD